MDEIANLLASIATFRPCLSRARSLDHITAGLHYCRQSLFSKEFRFVPKAWSTPACLRSQFIVIPHPPSCVFATIPTTPKTPTYQSSGSWETSGSSCAACPPFRRAGNRPCPSSHRIGCLWTLLLAPATQSELLGPVRLHVQPRPSPEPAGRILRIFIGTTGQYCPHFQFFLSYLTLPALPTTVPSTRDQPQVSVTSIYFWLTTA